MLRKKESYTIITPIPQHVPRHLALDILHSHSEIITLNPLVLSHHPIKAPRDAPADEYYSTWYEITERVQYLPGMGKVGSSKISFKGCFHDEPWGLETHMYAPMGIDLKSKWRIAGDQPDSHGSAEVRRKASWDKGAQDGIYLREDVEIECNVALMSFVRKELKASSKVLVDRLIKKAELLDAGVLHEGRTEDGKLKTFNPADRSSIISESLQLPLRPGQALYQMPMSRSDSASTRLRSTSSSTGPPQYGQGHSRSVAVELPADYCYPSQPPGESGKGHESPDSNTDKRYYPAGLSAMKEGLERA